LAAGRTRSRRRARLSRVFSPEAFGPPESMATDYSQERERTKPVVREKFRRAC
jgi:hypothetical protein